MKRNGEKQREREREVAWANRSSEDGVHAVNDFFSDRWFIERHETEPSSIASDSISRNLDFLHSSIVPEVLPQRRFARLLRDSPDEQLPFVHFRRYPHAKNPRRRKNKGETE